MSASERFCTQCRHTISPRGGATPEYCPICGRSMSAATAPPRTVPYAPRGTTPADRSGKATASFVLGIFSLIVCGVVLGIIAIVLGSQARKEIDASRGRVGGRGLATAGITLGAVGIALSVGWGLLSGGLRFVL